MESSDHTHSPVRRTAATTRLARFSTATTLRSNGHVLQDAWLAGNQLWLVIN
jgi:hypothetical protein